MAESNCRVHDAGISQQIPLNIDGIHEAQINVVDGFYKWARGCTTAVTALQAGEPITVTAEDDAVAATAQLRMTREGLLEIATPRLMAHGS